VGRPTITEIQPDQIADLLPPGSSAHRARFGLLRLAISIWPATEEWLERVWVSVSLDSAGDQAPTLWSMIPDRASSTRERRRHADARSESQVRRGQIRDQTQRRGAFGLGDHLRVDGERGGWELARVPGESLRGSYEFATVIKGGRDRGDQWVVQYDATVGRRRFGLISASCEVADDDGVCFSLRPGERCAVRRKRCS